MFVLGLLTTALVAGDALARGGKGGGDSGGNSGGSYGGGGSGGHSGGFSGGGHSSGPSFSGGSSRGPSGGGSSMRSFSGGGHSSGPSFSGGSSRGPSGGGSSMRSFSGGGHSSGGASSLGHGSSSQGLSSPRSLQYSSPSGHGGGQSSPSFSRAMRSNSGGGQPNVSNMMQQMHSNSGSRHVTTDGQVQHAGGTQFSNQGQGANSTRGHNWNKQPSSDQVQSFLQLPSNGHGGDRVETNYRRGGGGNGGGSGVGGVIGGGGGGGGQIIGGHGPGSSQHVIGTQSGGDGSYSGSRGSGGHGSGGQGFGTGGNDSHGGNQGGGQGGPGAISGGHGGPGAIVGGHGGPGGAISGGHGGDVAHGGWSRRTNAADFQRTADSVRRHWNSQWNEHDADHGGGHGGGGPGDGHGGGGYGGGGPGHDRPFHGDWWRDHRPHDHGGFYWDRYPHQPYFWWTWASAPRINTWFSFGWPRPYYWDYGPGEYIYCYNGVIYVNGQWYMPAREYYQRTYVLVERVPEVTPEQAQQIEWLPLGVFAMTPEGTDRSDLVLQLAVTDDGVLGGTLFNQATGESFAVEGVVEKATQRAVWSYADAAGKRIVMETGIYNFTKPDTTALVHFSPDDMQIWQMVRLEQPGEAAAAPAAGPNVPPAETPELVLPQPK
jgi:hypothetical protein